MNVNEIDALINLIDDPDEEIYAQVREKIVSYGEEVIPHLENIWELNSFGLEFQQRIEDIIHVIQFDSVYAALERWAKDGGKDLFEGALLIARYQYPDLDELEAKENLMKIRQDIWLELNDDLTALEKVKVFNHVLFDIYGFRGNRKNYHAAQNSYINTVLESKKGNPLSLSLLFIVIADSLGIPIYGVNLPNHFLLAYLDEFNIMKYLEGRGKEESDDPEVLFYVNAFSKGTIVHKSEITQYLEQINLEQKKEYFLPCSNLDIIRRILNNLILSYDRLGYPEKVKELKRLHFAVSEKESDKD
jgi:hypothetical protein